MLSEESENFDTKREISEICKQEYHIPEFLLSKLRTQYSSCSQDSNSGTVSRKKCNLYKPESQPLQITILQTQNITPDTKCKPFLLTASLNLALLTSILQISELRLG